MRLVVTEFITLDGVIEDPGGSEGSKYGGWSFPYWSEEIGKFKFEELLATSVHLLGRITYQGFAAAWPSRTDEAGFADRMNSLPKYVISTTLTKAEWNNSTIIKNNIAAEVSKLKGESGNDILVAGSATLVQTLIQYNLVDEYRLLTYPIVLGTGRRLFSEDNYAKLRLIESRSFPTGVVLLRYEPEK